jgi:hypothetical protein
MASDTNPAVGSALRLFKRNVELTLIFQKVSTGFFDVGFNPSDIGTNAVVIKDLRVEFEVKKNLAKEPNPCTVTVSNLAKETRGSVERKPVYAILRAGHDGILRPLFEGHLTFAQSKITGPNWETKMQIADGGRAFSHGRSNISYSPPVKVKQVLRDACASFGLGLPPELEQLQELDQALPGGFSAYGPTRDIMTRLLAPYGYTWSFQGGRIQILKIGQANAREAWVIEGASGMLGSPEGKLPDKPGSVAEVTVSTLLFPEIVPGDTIQINSREYDGAFFRVDELSHKGDTHGADWVTEMKTSPLGSPPKHKGKKGK